MCPYEYYPLMLNSKDPRYIRLKMVQSAKRLGAMPAAREHKITPKPFASDATATMGPSIPWSLTVGRPSGRLGNSRPPTKHVSSARAIG